MGQKQITIPVKHRTVAKSPPRFVVIDQTEGYVYDADGKRIGCLTRWDEAVDHRYREVIGTSATETQTEVVERSVSLEFMVVEDD